MEGKEQIIKILNEFKETFNEEGYGSMVEGVDEKHFPAIAEKISQLDGWVKAEDSLPEIDKNDEWNMRYMISEDVLTYSKQLGQRRGRYFHTSKTWGIEGIPTIDVIYVTHWQPLPSNPD